MKNKPYPYYLVEEINDFREFLSYIKNEHGDKTAITYKKRRQVIHISYNELYSDVYYLSAYLLNLGINNMRIAVIGENSYEWILTYLAAVNTNNVIIPIDKELPLDDIKNIVNDSKANVFVFSHTYRDVSDYLNQSEININHYFDMNDFFEILSNGKKMIQNKNVIENIKIDNKNLSVLLYTSGTTGMAKGVMLSQKNVLSSVLSLSKSCRVSGSNLHILPLHHSLSSAGVLVMLYYGCNNIINKSLKTFASDLIKYKPDNIVLVPLFIETFYNKIWNTAKKNKKDKSLRILIKLSNLLLKIGIDLRVKLFKSILDIFGGNIKYIISGGAPINSKYIKDFRSIGISILNAYGITECSPGISFNREFHYCDNSVGTILSGCEAKILNPDQDGNGEICVKGDNVMIGYYKNEEATENVFEQGWFKTGDIGYINKDGFLFITGRKKNLIILNNGKNVYPEELEFSLQNFLPYIKEIIVFEKDNIIVAEMYLDTENYDKSLINLDQDIIRFNKSQPPYKNIAKFIVRDKEFEKTTIKKIKRQYK